MRLTIKEPQIELYKDGFEGNCKLGRRETGTQLSKLVEDFDENLVIALDGAWGSGKSFFLKCWVGQHLQDHGASTQTVYFDAFQHDYLDDPLIALTAAISERIEQEPESKAAKAWKVAKNAAPFLGKAALRLGTAALVGKAISLTGEDDGAANDIGDKLAEESGEISKSLAEFWSKEDGKRAAMEAFKKALVQLTQPDEAGSPTQKLVIVIDELDRCRPDYALSLLEIIKHFFAVDGVHFVLGVNLKELQNSVRARYGAGVDAAKYLSKFITLQLALTNTPPPHGPKPLRRYAEHLILELGLHQNKTLAALDMYLELPALNRTMSLRDLERIITQAALIIPFDTQWSGKYANWLLMGLIIIKIQFHDEYEHLRKGVSSSDDLLSKIGVVQRRRGLKDTTRATRSDKLSELWSYFLHSQFGATTVEDENRLNEEFIPEDLYVNNNKNEVIPEIIRLKLSFIEEFQGQVQ